MEHNIPSEKKTNVAYSYIRFSSPAQMKGDSLGRQTEASETYAREHGLYIDSKAWAKKRLMALETKTPQSKNCPNWLQLVKDEDGKKKFVVIPERAALLVRMFELAAEGLGKRSIANILNADGIKSWRGGGEWAESTLHFLLKWPAAMGVYQPCRLDPETRRRIPEGPPIEGYFPQIVSNELWLRAQCRTQAPRGPRRPNTHNLFTGLVYDGYLEGYKM
ncbi:MAG TPA: recombinase family protein, partial [Terrimicrobiaceae bacterium]|nr:recombinase family protein [Terrimicrobiaceae bacterium]